LTRVYRIVRKLYAKKPVDGEGAFRFGGRWSSPGTRLAYTSQHLSLAMIEYYIHVDPGDRHGHYCPAQRRKAGATHLHLLSEFEAESHVTDLGADGGILL